jgi:hypothetical protein
VLDVPERDQASQEPDPMAGVLCMHCGSGDDDDLLLLCDGAPHNCPVARIPVATAQSIHLAHTLALAL